MKLIKLAFVAFSASLFISGCNHDYGTKKASTNEIQQIFYDQQSGFIVIKNEIDAPFLDEVQKMLLEKRKKPCSSTSFIMIVKTKTQMD